jgi:beta-lactamase superfamily II metal-dependent hydrolase
MAQGYYVDFIAVGDGERSGDAISVLYITDAGARRVMVIDGGDKAAGRKLVDRIRRYYNTNRVDYLVNTHPDADHASGLEIILEEMEVGQVWIHQPWKYPEHIYPWCQDGRITPNSLRERLCDALGHAYRVFELASEKGIPVYEPYQGARIGEYFWVASPSHHWYLDIIPHFDKSPETNAPPPQGLIELAKILVEKAATWIDETFDIETLKANPSTSYDNESSVVLYGNIDGRGILLTGDAGVQALNRAAAYLENYINIPASLNLIQIPHHGSRHNVDSAVLDRLIGQRLKQDGLKPDVHACVTAGAKSETHPRRAVVNAFRRRGVGTWAAKGRCVMFRHNLPARPDYSQIGALPFYDKVEI